MEQRLSKGELEFIKGCTKAIINNNTDNHHWLIKVGAIKHYVTHKDEFYPENHPVFKNAECIAAIGGEFIKDWHNKAGNDDLSRPWIKQSLKKLLANSESFAATFYAQNHESPISEQLKSIKTEGLSKEGKEEYLKKVTTLLQS